MTEFLFLDTETTNDDPECRMIQLAYKTSDGKTFSSPYKPPMEINPAAMAVHHITNEMVADAPVFEGSQDKLELGALLATHTLVAHNAKFDKAVLEREGLTVNKVICTLKNAQRLWPELPQHKMQFLRYHHGLEIKTEQDAHDARADIAVLEPLFYFELEALQKELTAIKRETLIEIMEEISTQPQLIHIARFGKYKGKTFKEIRAQDPGWINWLLEQPDIDEDLRYTLKYWKGMPR